MQRLSKLGLIYLQVLTLVGYATLIWDRSHRIGNLSLHPPADPFLPDAVVRLGFWSPWGFVLMLLISLCGVAYRFATRSTAYYIAVAVTFALLSALDFRTCQLMKYAFWVP